MMSDEEKLLKMKKENSFLMVRLLLKDEMIKLGRLFLILEKEQIVASNLIKQYDKLKARNDDTNYIFKITGERI